MLHENQQMIEKSILVRRKGETDIETFRNYKLFSLYCCAGNSKFEVNTVSFFLFFDCGSIVSAKMQKRFHIIIDFMQRMIGFRIEIRKSKSIEQQFL